MTEFVAPIPPRCAATAPDLWTVECELEPGHDGPHANGGTRWRQPQIVTVGGEIPDLETETEHWQDGDVRFSWEEPAL